MKLVRLPNAGQAGMRAAQLAAAAVEKRPGTVLALPTGETPKNMYAELARMRDQGLDLSGVTAFALDEYVGAAKESPYSFVSSMGRHFYAELNVPSAQRHVFDSRSDDPEAECRRYDRDIAAAGGFDLAVFGIGNNGHIAFNEPGEFLTLASHVQKLSEDTIRRNHSAAERGQDPEFPGARHVEEFPPHAMTVGMDAILNARSIVLLATAAARTEAIAGMLNGRITTRLPASLLHAHRDCSVLIDPAAAGKLGPVTPI